MATRKVRGQKAGSLRSTAPAPKKSSTVTNKNKTNSSSTGLGTGGKYSSADFGSSYNLGSGGSSNKDIPPPPVYSNVDYSNKTKNNYDNNASNVDYNKIQDASMGVTDKQENQFNYGQFANYMNDKGYSNTIPSSKTEATPYSGMFSSKDITDAFNKIKDMNYKYDPAQDTLLKLSQDQAMSQAAKGLASRGMLYSDSAKNKMFQSAMNLTPQFEQRAYNRYQGKVGDLYDQLRTMQGLETTNIDRYRTTEQDRRNIEETNRKRFVEDVDFQKGMYDTGVADTKRIRDNEISKYGYELSPRMRNYAQAYSTISQPELQRLLPLGQQPGGFATTINQLKQTDPNSPDIAILETLRAMKVLSNPEMLAKYGAEYDMQTGAITEAGEDRSKKQLLDNIKLLGEQAKTEKTKEEINKIQKQVEEIESSTKYKDEQTKKMEYEKLIKELEYKELPTKLKNELKQDLLDIAKTKASTANIYSQISDRDKKFSAEYEADDQGGYKKKLSAKDQMQGRVTETIINQVDTLIRDNGVNDAMDWLHDNRGSIEGKLGEGGFENIFNVALAPAIQRGDIDPYKTYYRLKEDDPMKKYFEMMISNMETE